MHYEFDLTVPANTAKSSPVTLDLVITKGIITKAAVQFPIGTRALVHAKIYRGGHQLWPANAGGDIKADGYVVEWDEYEIIDDEPVALKLLAWSTADTYDYDITVRIDMSPLEVTEEVTGILGSMKKLLNTMGIRT